MTKADILGKLIELYADNNKTQFAKMMGTTPQNIGNWIRRETIPYEDIYKICAGLNPHWLLTGEGVPLLSMQQADQVIPVAEDSPNRSEMHLLDRLEAQAKRIGVLEFMLEEEKRAHAATKEKLLDSYSKASNDLHVKDAGGVDDSLLSDVG